MQHVHSMFKIPKEVTQNHVNLNTTCVGRRVYLVMQEQSSMDDYLILGTYLFMLR